MQLFQIIIIIFISYYVVLTLTNHCSVYEEELMVVVALVQACSACSAFHNDDPYGVEDAQAYIDASVEEVCDDDGDDSNVAVGNRSHCEYDDILRPFHIHPTDTGSHNCLTR
jgi:hypothetical protein